MTAHYVYRCYDAEGRLAYVGQTKNAINRLHQHRSTAFWASEVVHIRVSVHKSADIARAVERRAIRDENPRFNVMGRWESRSGWTRDDYLDFTRAVMEGANTNATRNRLELIFKLYAEAFNQEHPGVAAIRAEFDRREAERTADATVQRAEWEERTRRVTLSDRQGMYAHFAFCDPCALAGEYANDCPDILLDEEAGVLLPLRGRA